MKRFIPFLILAASLMGASPPSLAQGQSAVQSSLKSGSAACITTGANPNCLIFKANTNIGGIGFSTGSTTFSGTVQFEIARDPAGAIFNAMQVTPDAGGAAVSSATTNGSWSGQCAGCTAVRMRVSSYSSGTLVASIQPSTVAYIAPGASGGGTPGGSNTQVQFNDSSAFGGATNILYTKASGVFGISQKANNNETIYGTRFTDTSPTGNLIHFQNAAANADLFLVDANGNVSLGSDQFGISLLNSLGASGFKLSPQISTDILLAITGSGNVSIGGNMLFNAAGKITTYNTVPTVANGVAYEVAAANLTAQTAAITTTTLGTPAFTGMYRIQIYAKVTTVDGASSVLGGVTGLTIGYTDGSDSVAQTTVAQLATETGTAAIHNAGNTTATKLIGSVDVFALTAVPITYAFDYTSGTPGTMTYELRLVLESL